MELGCSLRPFGEMRLAESCRKVHQIGFGYVELDWQRICREWPMESRRVASVKEMLLENDLKAAGVYLDALTAERTDQLKLQVRNISRSFEAIRQIGGNLVILEGGPRTLENFNCLRDGLHDTLIKDAERFELEMAIANRIDTRIENSQDLQAFFYGKPSERLGVCIDVHHFHLAAVNAGDIVREMADRIKLCRISDLMGRVPVLPGQGEIEIKGLIRALHRVNFTGCIVADHLPGREEKVERELEQAYAYLTGIIA